MPMFDLLCPGCGLQRIDVLQPVTCEQPLCDECQTPMQRAWLTKPSNVVGDECDVWVRHGICNEDGSPRRYTSKSEMARAAKEKGWTNAVRHVGIDAGSDKSPHTTRWY